MENHTKKIYGIKNEWYSMWWISNQPKSNLCFPYTYVYVQYCIREFWILCILIWLFVPCFPHLYISFYTVPAWNKGKIFIFIFSEWKNIFYCARDLYSWMEWKMMICVVVEDGMGSKKSNERKKKKRWTGLINSSFFIVLRKLL